MIISYEKGKASPDELFMARLSKYTGVSVEDLLRKKLSEENLNLGKVEKLEKGSDPVITKKPGLVGPDWKEFALEMKGLAESWRHLSESQKVFIDQMQTVSFNLNKLLLGVSELQEEGASEQPAAAAELLQTGRSGPFQISTQNVPAGSSVKKGK